jgi:putative tricarboxylic transport membrane protein
MVNAKNLVTGGTLFALGAAMAIAARGFPTIGAMAYGPGLFPTIIAFGLMASGLGIAAENIAASPDPKADGGEKRQLLPLIGVLAVIAFFALALDLLGFHITAAVSLLVAARIFRGSWVTAVSMAIIGPLILHFLFYSVLRVPLPWGLLLPIAW